MGIKAFLRDPKSGLQAFVKKTGLEEENALCMKLSGIQVKTTVPIFDAPISGAEVFSFQLEDGLGSPQMAGVDGSSTPIPYRYEADENFDTIINEIVIDAQDASIKLSSFLGQGNPLTNGFIISYKADDTTTSFPTIDTTHRLLAFSTGFQAIYSEQGGGSALAFRDLNPPILIRAKGSHNSGKDDYIQALVQDNFAGINDMRVTVRGVKIPKGIF